MWKVILLILAGLYTLNPYDIFPDMAIGWGWLDDLIIWILVWRYLVISKKKLAGYRRFDQNRAGRSENGSRRNYSRQARSESKDQYAEEAAAWDPYRILGIERSASAEEIKHAYRELVKQYHPDKLEHLGDEFKVLAEKRFKEIQQAYQELTGKGG